MSKYNCHLTGWNSDFSIVMEKIAHYWLHSAWNWMDIWPILPVHYFHLMAQHPFHVLFYLTTYWVSLALASAWHTYHSPMLDYFIVLAYLLGFPRTVSTWCTYTWDIKTFVPLRASLADVFHGNLLGENSDGIYCGPCGLVTKAKWGISSTYIMNW